MTYWIRPLIDHHNMGITANGPTNPYPEESFAGRMWRSGNAFHHGSPDQAFEALACGGKILLDTQRKMPTAKSLAEKIGLPLDKWTGNCAGVSALVLPHLDLDLAMTAYGFYTGRVEPGTFFAKTPIVRHGWIETLDGLVIDPTRWVFKGSDPEIYVGSVADYDYGMMRYKSNTPFPEPSANMTTIEFDDEQVEFVAKLTGITPDGNIFTMARNQASWLADRPIQTLDIHFMAIIDAIDQADAAWIGEDTRNWRDANLQ